MVAFRSAEGDTSFRRPNSKNFHRLSMHLSTPSRNGCNLAIPAENRRNLRFLGRDSGLVRPLSGK